MACSMQAKGFTTLYIPYCPLQNSTNQYHVWYLHHPIHHREEGLPPVTTLCEHYFVLVIMKKYSYKCIKWHFDHIPTPN